MSLHLNDGKSPSHENEISMSRELKRGHEQNSAFLPLTNCKGEKLLTMKEFCFQYSTKCTTELHRLHLATKYYTPSFVHH
jgi:hypothetical protein